MKVYKIRDKETGLYLLSGSGDDCNELGAGYNTVGAAKVRVRWAEKYYNRWAGHWAGTGTDCVFKHTWEIVEFEVTETETRTIPVAELVKEET